MMPATPIQPREISSNTTASEDHVGRQAAVFFRHEGGRNRPILRIVRTISSGYWPDDSISLATGRICSSTNDLIVSRSSRLLVRQLKIHDCSPGSVLAMRGLGA